MTILSTRLPWFGPGKCPLYLAPMARYTDAAFRQLCKEQGADVMVTEFVMCEALLLGNAATWRTVDFTPEQRPMGVQVFGSVPERMAEAAVLVAERLQPDFIDINCGCPADKVTDQNAGASLLKDPTRLAGIVRAVVAVSPVPVTVKIRIGWDAQQINALEIGQRVQDAGAEALAIHGRTKEQGYRGEADWEVINHVAEQLDIPVIGNGSVDSAAVVASLRNCSPVSGLMIGRAALGYPWLFREIKHFLATGQVLPPPSLSERWDTLFRYCELLQSFRTDRRNPGDIGWMRAKIKALTKDMPGVKQLRPKIDAMRDLNELRTIASDHLKQQTLTSPQSVVTTQQTVEPQKVVTSPQTVEPQSVVTSQPAVTSQKVVTSQPAK